MMLIKAHMCNHSDVHHNFRNLQFIGLGLASVSFTGL